MTDSRVPAPVPASGGEPDWLNERIAKLDAWLEPHRQWGECPMTGQEDCCDTIVVELRALRRAHAERAALLAQLAAARESFRQAEESRVTNAQLYERALGDLAAAREEQECCRCGDAACRGVKLSPVCDMCLEWATPTLRGAVTKMTPLHDDEIAYYEREVEEAAKTTNEPERLILLAELQRVREVRALIAAALSAHQE